MRNSLLFVALMVSVGVTFAAGGNAPSGTGSRGAAQGLRGSVPTLQSGTPGRVMPIQRTQAQTSGRGLGEHVSGMAPEHPKMHGRLFGDCVSELAITGQCSHHLGAN